MGNEYREDMVDHLAATRKKASHERHLLITVSEDETYLHGLRFVGNFVQHHETLKVTLFYVAPLPPKAYDKHEFQSVEHMDLRNRSGEIRGRKALEQATRVLMDMGLPREQIKTRFKYREFSTAMDIVTEAHRGLYDAAVLGHRGISSLEQFWNPSVGKTILDSNFDVPLWICRRPDYSRKNVLLCMDGSGSSMCMVDHVGYMLAREPHHQVTLFFVQMPSLEDESVGAHIFGLARKTLTENGMPAERIQTKTASSSDVAAAILHEAHEGCYAVVGMGRTGRNHGFLKRIFLGSVSTAVFQNLQGAVLWICQ